MLMTVIMADREVGIKNAFKVLNNHCHQWKLKANCRMTNVVFGRGRAQTERYQFDFRDERVDIIGEYRYLGALFSSNGRFRRGQQECC